MSAFRRKLDRQDLFANLIIVVIVALGLSLLFYAASGL